MSYIYPNKAVLIPLSLVFVAILSPYLLPTTESVETFLLSYLRDKRLVWGTKSLMILLICLLPFYLYQLSSKLSSKAQLEFIETFKENIFAKDKLRIEVFESDFDDILSKHASRGFPALTGLANADITDLYKNELNIFADSLANITIEVSSKSNLRPSFILPTVKDLLFGKAHSIKDLYIVFIEKYFSSLQKDHQLQMKDSFSLLIDDATNSLIKKIETEIKLKENLHNN